MNTKHKKTGGSASIGLQQLVILLNVLVLLFLLAATALLFITNTVSRLVRGEGFI